VIDTAVGGGTNVLLQYGIAGVFIIALVIAVVYLVKELKATRARNDTIQDQRLAEAKEVRDKLTEPLEKIGTQNEKIYDVLLNFDKRRR
jgi:hypothetical protein